MNRQFREVYKRFGTRALQGDQAPRIEQLREATISLAWLFARSVPECHEHMRALNALDDALGHAIAGMTRHEEWTQTEKEVLVKPSEPAAQGTQDGSSWDPERLKRMQESRMYAEKAKSSFADQAIGGAGAGASPILGSREVTTSYL